MTEQIADTITYDGEEYQIVFDPILGSYLFDRYELKKYINGTSTNCYKGYFAHYEIETTNLYLTSLTLLGAKEPIPAFDNMIPIITYGFGRYAPIYKAISTSGHIIFGKPLDRFSDVAPRRLFPRPLEYESLFGLTLIKGEPIVVEDFSEEISEVRNQLKGKPVSSLNPEEGAMLMKLDKKVLKEYFDI
jgi:hypothetical protein